MAKTTEKKPLNKREYYARKLNEENLKDAVNVAKEALSKFRLSK